MVEHAERMDVLLIQYWIRSGKPIRDALDAAGIVADITRVDIEPALNAALSWQRYRVAIFDPDTQTITEAAVEACVRRHDIPLVVADDLATLGVRVLAALRDRDS